MMGTRRPSAECSSNEAPVLGAAALISKGWRDAPKDFDRLRGSGGVTVGEAC